MPARPLRLSLVFSVLLAALALATLASLYVGRAAFDPRFLPLRWHRTQVAFFAGAGLAVGGVVLQGLFRNPLASPSILGTTAGAALGGQLALVAVYAAWGARAPFGLPSELAMPLGCVAGALVTLAIVLGLAPLRASPIALLLSGFLLSALFSSLSTLLESMVQEDWQLSRTLHVLSAGSLSGAGPRQSALVAVLCCGAALPAWAWARELDVLLSGEDEARSLGVDVRRARFWLIVWSAFLSAGAVAVGAHVTFVGLIVPHVLRRFIGHGHRALIPAAFAGGGTFLLACDVLCRLTPLRNEVPLGAVTALIGGPLFLRLLVRLETEGAA
ncbi:MAG TPA: iron ABC transporter permease [Polyangiales bacterium]|nr:iron ABC transporter permease [Polyangiales bacterium]